MMHGTVVAEADSFRQALAQVDTIMAPLDEADMQRPDAELIKSEFTLAADFIRHSAKRGLFLLDEGDSSAADLRSELDGLIARYRKNWLARNRPGGLDDSAARFNTALESYQ
jgi:hypothetical protein